MKKFIILLTIYLSLIDVILSQTTFSDLGSLSDNAVTYPSVYNSSAVYNDRLYIAGDGKVYIYWIDNPGKPIYYKKLPSLTDVKKVWVGEMYLFVYNGATIKIYELGDPNNPLFRSEYEAGADLQKVSARGNYMFVLYMADSVKGKDGSFEIVDIKNPEDPRLSGTFKPENSEGESFFFSVEENKVFVAHKYLLSNNGYVREIDYSTPTNPTVTRTIEIAGMPRDMSVDSSRLFVLSSGVPGDGPSILGAYETNVTPISKIASVQVSDSPPWNIHVYGNTISLTLLNDGIKDYTWNVETKSFIEGPLLKVTNASQLSHYIIDPVIEDDLLSKNRGLANNTAQSSNTACVWIYYYILEKSSTSNGREIEGNVIRLVEKENCWIEGEPTPKVNLTTVVNPIDALLDGCSVSPVGITEQTIGSNVNLSARASNGWLFTGWTGLGSANPINVVMEKDTTMIANFQPQLVLNMDSRPEGEYFCPPKPDEGLEIATVNIFAGGVDWQLTDITFNSIEKFKPDNIEAWIEYDSTKLKGTFFNDTDGFVNKILFNPVVQIDEGRTLEIKLIFKFLIPSTLSDLPDAWTDVKKFKVSTNFQDIICLPIPPSAQPGIKTPEDIFTSNTQIVASLWNVSSNNDKPYSSINEAIKDANEGDEIYLCPCLFEENSIIDKSVKIKSVQGKENTKFLLSNLQKGFIINADKVSIEGITIDGNNLAEVGIQLMNTSESEIRNSSIINCDKGISIGDGWLASAVKNNIEQNDISNNNIGIFVQNGERNSFVQNLIHHNKNAGIEIGSGETHVGFQTITRNEIFSNETGIESISGNCSIIDNKIYNNTHDGINQLINFKEGRIIGNSIYENLYNGINIHDGSNSEISGNSIVYNKFAGINLKNAENIVIKSNKLLDHIDTGAKGISVKNSSNIKILNNIIMGNCTDMTISESKNIITKGNKIKNALCFLTGISVNNSTAKITSNDISNNAGYGIFLSDNSQVLINSNNIFGNSVFGINNSDPSIIIDATNNWWGDAGPGTSGVQGNVLTSGWLSTPVSLICFPEKDTINTLPGQSDSIFIYLNNFKFPDDIIDVTLSDEQGWISNPVIFSTNMQDIGVSNKITFNVPTNLTQGDINKVHVLAVSRSEGNIAVKDSFYISVYNPQLKQIAISPDSSTVMVGDSLQFSVSGVDQFGNSLNVNPVWQTSLGEITQCGLFKALSTGIASITATDSSTGVQTKTTVFIGEEEAQLIMLNISPDSVKLKAGETLLFKAKGVNQFGFPHPIQVKWTCDRELIDDYGLFVADSVTSTCTVIAEDTLTGIKGTARVFIDGVVQVEDKRITPAEYSLFQNYPNPFNPVTIIPFTLPERGMVELRIYNLLGEEIVTLVNAQKDAGYYNIKWDPIGLASGIYLYQIKYNSLIQSRKMIYLK